MATIDIWIQIEKQSANSATPVPPGGPRSVVVTGNPGDMINYQCGIHLAAMTGMIQIL